MKNILSLRIGEREKEIIKLVGLGVLAISSLIIPNLPLVLKVFLKNEGPKRFKKTLDNLEEKDVIYLSGEKFKLTNKGKSLLKNIQLREIIIDRPSVWDKKWRLVSYDIPDYKKKERDWFRYNLKRLDFVKMQESLWVFPYECREEIALMVQNLGISPYIVLMKTDSIPSQEKWKKYFNIS